MVTFLNLVRYSTLFQHIILYIQNILLQNIAVIFIYNGTQYYYKMRRFHY